MRNEGISARDDWAELDGVNQRKALQLITSRFGGQGEVEG